MKKVLALTLAATLLLLCACGPTAPPAAVEIPSGPPSEAVSPGNLFVFTRDNFPRMDGSTSTIPLGQAVACVLLGEPRQDVADLALFQKTTQSFRNLLNGQADILLVAEPNPVVFDEMTEAGFRHEMRPIATDALVFIVNADNPVDGLTTEQVQKIYTGEITNWSQVGGADMDIKAFQRNAESGSQALMDKLVMEDLTAAAPPEGYRIGDMEGLVSAVRSFDGSAQAIGYTVYYYAEDMRMAEGLKILAIDGVVPGDGTIADGAYPFLNPYYAVISAGAPAGSPARVLYDWLLTPEGQALIRGEGYVPVAG